MSLHHRRTSARILAGTTALAAAAVLAGCTAGASGNESDTDDPIRIGASLPLTGPVADRSGPGYNGYELWAEQVNESGGLLGRPVELVVLDDGFDQDQVVSNYTRLISQDRVDLLLGTFSSALNLPASAVAERNGMVYVEPSGGAQEIFEQGFTRLFFAQPGTSETLPDRFLEWVESLPEDERPATAAFLTQTDPNTEPAVQGIQDGLEALGVETVYDDSYPVEQTSFDAVADAIGRAAPQVLIHGAVAEDGASLVQALQRVGFTPEVLFQTNAPTDTVNYPDSIGAENTEGIFTPVSWTPSAQFPGSQEFVEAYETKYGTTPNDDASSSFAAAQILQTAVEAVGEIDQDGIAEWLHANTVETIAGPMSWDERGVPQGSLSLAQWQDGRLVIVLPEDAAETSSVVYPKPAWVG
ncbi:amino acid ABC transporter substrate-binding protein [Agromyces sp. Soil535]|uniref:amino acid ABC transporter substrate-binding protein n=1 Tax=Agromyces sp. Soil535 TaxID=1736390 RepID=UPI0009E7006C|nr:amino acid ABC transporter substrate-binding protein [Agromyces sp. Soil535]